MQDVVGRINSDMRLLEEKGHNMVSRLSDMRGQISSSEHQRRRVVEELEDARAQLEEVTGAHMQAQEDVDAAGPAAAELHERRVALDNQISQLTREQRDVQRVADNAALELAKVKDSLSNAEVEDNMYASRLEQIDEQLEEVTASLESRRDRAEELDGALDAGPPGPGRCARGHRGRPVQPLRTCVIARARRATNCPRCARSSRAKRSSMPAWPTARRW